MMLGQKVPFVTGILIAIIAVCTFAAWAAPVGVTAAGTAGVVLPAWLLQILAFLQPVSVDNGPLPLFSYMFLHGSMPHFICNVVSLAYIGAMVERLYGHLRMFAGFIVSGLAGGLLFRVVAAYTGSGASCVGASGALFGLLGMYVAFLVAELVAKEPLYMRKAVAGSLLASAVGVIGVNVFISLMPGISCEAHLGGFIAGIVIAALMLWQMRSRARASLGAARPGSGSVNYADEPRYNYSDYRR